MELPDKESGFSLSRAGRLWREKAALTFGLAAFFCAGYFGLQQADLFPPYPIPLTGPDRWIGFRPEWTGVYQSIYLLLPVTPWLAATPAELRVYARGFLLLSVVSFAVFSLFPVEAPRPVEHAPGHALFNLLTAYEGRLNAFPSLHAGLIAYSIFFGERISRGTSRPRRALLLAGLSFWGAAILFAALAVKQHYWIDLPAGIGLAWVCHRAAWRSGNSAVLAKEETGWSEAGESA